MNISKTNFPIVDIADLYNGNAYSYRGYTFHAVIDDCVQNPYDDIDCLPPIKVKSSNGNAAYGVDIPDYLMTKLADALNPAFLHLNAQFLASALLDDVSVTTSLLQCKNLLCAAFYADYDDKMSKRANYEKWYNTDSYDKLYDAIDEWLSESDANIINLAHILDIPCNIRRHRTQSDWYAVIVLLTDEWYELTGCKNDATSNTENISSAAQLYFDWVSGNVHGYTFPDSDTLFPCWGFYGDSHEASGLFDSVTSEIDAHINRVNNILLRTTKTLIRRRVPLHLRAERIAHLIEVNH